MHVVAPPELRGGHEQPAVIAVEQLPVTERIHVDDRHAAATRADTHRLDAGGVAESPRGVCLARERRHAVEIAHPVARRTRPGGRRPVLFLLEAAARILGLLFGRRLRLVLLPVLMDNPRPPLEIVLAVDQRPIDDETAAGCNPALERVASAPAQAPMPG